jgi:hypothetical protein
MNAGDSLKAWELTSVSISRGGQEKRYSTLAVNFISA